MSEPKRIPVTLVKHHRSPGNGEFLAGMVAGFHEDEARDLIARGVAIPFVQPELREPFPGAILDKMAALHREPEPVPHEGSPSVVEGMEAFSIAISATGTVSPPPPADPTPIELSTPKKKKKG